MAVVALYGGIHHNVCVTAEICVYLSTPLKVQHLANFPRSCGDFQYSSPCKHSFTVPSTFPRATSTPREQNLISRFIATYVSRKELTHLRSAVALQCARPIINYGQIPPKASVPPAKASRALQAFGSGRYFQRLHSTLSAVWTSG